MILLFLAALVAAVAFGRATARHRPAHRAVSWAEAQIEIRTRRSPWFWIAVLAVLAALIAVWTFHPFRSTVNVLAWRSDPDRAPAPDLDPDWATKRGGPTTNGHDPL